MEGRDMSLQIAPSALEAEMLAKAAILSGPRNAARRLEHGGVIVLDDGSQEVIEQPAKVSLSQLSAFAHPSARRVAQHV